MSVPTKRAFTLLLSLLVIVNVYTIYVHSQSTFGEQYPQAMIDCEGKRDAISELILNDYLQTDYNLFYDYQEVEVSLAQAQWQDKSTPSNNYDYSTLMLDFLCNCQERHLSPPQALKIEP